MVLLANPSFVAYAICCVVLCVNLLFLWAYSGARRGSTKTTANAEDAAAFGATLTQQDPPEVARILRAHANAEASIYPFLALGLVFVLAGGTVAWAAVFFTIFVVARLLHSFAYLKQRQPLRTIAFAAGGLDTIAVMAAIVWLLLRTA